MTYLIITINGHHVCPSCLHDDLITDLFHAETYCSNCGLIVKDPKLTPLSLRECVMDKVTQLKELAPTYEIHD